MMKSSLPKGWRIVNFGDLAESITERVDDPKVAGVEIYVGLEHLDSDTTKISRFGTPEDVESTKLRFYPGDVIYARRRAYQRKLGVAEVEGICSAHALVLRARPEFCLPEFLPYFLQSDQFHERALSISVGSLSPTINWKTLVVQEFVLPPITEQHRIIKLLSTIDMILTTYTECPFERLTRAILQENLFDEKHGYASTKLGAIAQVQAGFAFKSNQFSISEGIPLIRIRDLGGDGTTEIKFDGDYDLDFEVHHGDFLIGMDGEFHCFRWGGSKALLNQRVCRVRSFDESLVVPEFVYFLLDRFLKEIEKTTASTTVKHISTKQIEKIEIPLPPVDIQLALVEKLKRNVELQSQVESECRDLGLIRRNLLNREIRNV